MPNAPIDERIPLSAFAVPLEPLEQVAGEGGWQACGFQDGAGVMILHQMLDLIYFH